MEIVCCLYSILTILKNYFKKVNVKTIQKDIVLLYIVNKIKFDKKLIDY